MLLLLFFLLKFAETNSELKLSPDVVKNGIVYDSVYDYTTNKSVLIPKACYQNGKITAPGELSVDGAFNYECVRNEKGELSYEATSCAYDWEIMRPGSEWRTANGSLVSKCAVFDGKLRKVTEHVRGCYYNGTVYEHGRAWNQPNLANNSVSFVEMTCRKTEEGYFESQTSGCVFQAFFEIRDADNEVVEYEPYQQTTNLNWYFKDANSTVFRKCVEIEHGQVDMVEVNREEVMCKVENVTYENGEMWQEGEESYYCNYGRVEENFPSYCTYKGRRVEPEEEWIDEQTGARLFCGPASSSVIKLGCVVNGKSVHLKEEVQLTNGCVLFCEDAFRNIYISEHSIEGMRIDRNRTLPERKATDLNWPIIIVGG